MSGRRQGLYRYWKDGILQPIDEPWSLQPTATGMRLEGERRVAGHVVLYVEAHYQDERCVGCDVTFHGARSARTLQASYRIEGNCLHWQRSDPEYPDRNALGTLTCGDRHHLFPLLRAATGVLIKRLAEHSGTVIVPWLRNPQDTAQLLLPLASTRSAVRQINGNEPGSGYRYYGGEYGDQGADCWLDASGMLRRYTWLTQDERWEVQLSSEPSAETIPQHDGA